eukprot:m.169037 g.169037  ORF g.169037 m.169037 type:complete len:642 (+) comp9915_c1_seq10:47-1972(+)
MASAPAARSAATPSPPAPALDSRQNAVEWVKNTFNTNPDWSNVFEPAFEKANMQLGVLMSADQDGIQVYFRNNVWAQAVYDQLNPKAPPPAAAASAIAPAAVIAHAAPSQGSVRDFVRTLLCRLELEHPPNFPDIALDPTLLQHILEMPLVVKIPVPSSSVPRFRRLLEIFPEVFEVNSLVDYDLSELWAGFLPIVFDGPRRQADSEMTVSSLVPGFFHTLPERLLKLAGLDALPLQIKRNQIEQFVSVGASRPDLAMVLFNTPVLLGEDKAGATVAAATAAFEDVVSKHAGGHSSVFGPVKYYFQYAASATGLTLYARSLERDSIPQLLRTFLFQSPTDRQALVIAVINLVRIALTWWPVLPKSNPVTLFCNRPSPYSELREVDRSSIGTVSVSLIGGVVKKEFWCPNDKVGELLDTYYALIQAAGQHFYLQVDYLQVGGTVKISRGVNSSRGSASRVHSGEFLSPAAKRQRGLSSTEPSTGSGQNVIITLAPRGENGKMPESELEYIHALYDILGALSAVHFRSLVHRDIRWDNVVTYKFLKHQRPVWILIDWEVAGPSGAAMWFDGRAVPAEAFDSYTCQHDLEECKAMFLLSGFANDPSIVPVSTFVRERLATYTSAVQAFADFKANFISTYPSCQL